MSETATQDEAPKAASAPAQANSNLIVRVITALVLAPLVLLLLFRGPAWGFALLIGLSAAQVTWEMLSMTHPGDRASRMLGGALAFSVSGALFFGSEEPRLVITAVMAALALGAMLPLARLGEIPSAALRTLAMMSAPLYVGVLLSSLTLMRVGYGSSGPSFVFFALLIAWMADTGGYVFGRLFGRTKLYEAVSPKKTREGLVGSILFSVGVSALASFTYLPEVPLFHAVVLGFVGALLGTLGDLVESLLKRSTGVKDSGSLLPGHGGLFDRVDALLIVGPLVYLYALWTV